MALDENVCRTQVTAERLKDEDEVYMFTDYSLLLVIIAGMFVGMLRAPIQ